MTPFAASQERIDRAVALIWDAVLEPERLSAAVGAVADATGAMGGMLGIFDVAAGEGHAPCVAGLDAGLLEVFEEHHVNNPWTEMAHRHAAPGRALSSERHVDTAVLRATAFHDAILAPQAIVAESFVLLRHDGRFQIGLPMMHTVPGRSTEPEVLRVHEGLARHFDRAFEMMRRVETLQSRLELREAALDHHRCGVLVTDGRARIRYANARAQRLLAEADGLLAIGCRLAARHNGDGQHLAAAIARAAAIAAGGAVAAGASLPVRRGPQRLPLLCMVLPGGGPRRLTEAPEAGAGTALLFVSDPSDRGSVAADLLRDAFGLTDREVSVALAAARLGGVPAAAAELGIAPSTARTHLQHVFDKTGARNQMALAHLLESLAVLPDADADRTR